jgi:acetyl esterase
MPVGWRSGCKFCAFCLPCIGFRSYNARMSNQLKLTRRTLLATGGAAALATPLAGPLLGWTDSAQTSSAAPLKVEKDVVVGKGGDVDLHCDIYRPPAGTEKHMALVHLHGGGFARGGKDTLTAKVTPITNRGYVSIAAQYRLTGVAKWPAQNEDVKTAIRWARANADSLGINPKWIATVGYSAGGDLALFAAGDPDTQLAACVAFYPAVQPAALQQSLLAPGGDEAAAKEASPLSHVKAGYPPTIIYHGLADVTVPPESSINLLSVLRGASVPSELHTFAGVPHEFDMHPEFAEACAALTDFFLDREVLNPRTYPPFGAGRGGPAPGAGRG